ncbi:PAAR domain-containing protein [Variovorax sp. J2P1-59]|uniref:PAAR domain-containing protein n=1 Tax=Variovorax flavidus TaxID=3053501 RepID=UPI0025778251|nr:PAAR domain-containing protein [Variovorax sp. J2P1-59]MDM0075081.1 PAAR domain-containing protein [Variovorax sp. J2P1-59]
MMRRFAAVGDTLRDGGRILPYASRPFTFGDARHQVALIGGQAYCEACNSIGTIAKTGGPRRLKFMGEAALDGDVVLCHCPSPPPIVAKLAGEAWYEDMGGGNDAVDRISPAQNILPASSPRFDQQIQILNEGTGLPLARIRYRLTGADGTFEGRTDDQGMTERVSCDYDATITLEIFGEDA